MGYDPAAITSPRATPDERKVYAQALKNTSKRELMRIAAPIRFRHESELKMLRDRSDALESFGISQADQELIRESGVSPWEYLNNYQRRQIMNVHPEWEPWLGLTSPFLSKDERDYWTQTREFWQTYNDAKTQLQIAQSRDTELVKQRVMSLGQWRTNYTEHSAQLASVWNMLTGSGGTRAMLPKALVTNEIRDTYRNQFGRPIPPIHLEDIAVQQYFAMEPDLNPITRRPDYDSLALRQREFIDSLPAMTKEYVQAELTRPRTEQDMVEREWKTDSPKLKPWAEVGTRLLQEHPEWNSMLQRLAYLRTADSEAAFAVRTSKIYKEYVQTLTAAHKQLRMSNAELEFLMLKWGIGGITKFINPESWEFYRSYVPSWD